MVRRASRVRVSRAGSLLILVSVMLLTSAGAVYLAAPAEAESPYTIITVTKHAPWDPGLAFQFTLESVSDPSWPSQNFSLKDAPMNWIGQSFDWLPLGTYRITEVIPSGWHAVSIVCRDRAVPSPIVATGDLATGSVTVTLTETLRFIDCDFSNDFIHGHLVMQKITNFGFPMVLPTVFDFDPDWSGDNFTLTSGQTGSFVLPPGRYSVQELEEPGWHLNTISCLEVNDPVGTLDVPNRRFTVDLAVDQVITCHFVNQNTQGGSISVEKVTSPTVPDHDFEFDPSWSTQDFAISEDDPPEVVELPLGTYSIGELTQSGWVLTGASCTYGTGPAVAIGSFAPATGVVSGLEIVDGRDITCTFTNSQMGTLRVVKETLPDGDLADFSFTGIPTTADADGELSDGEVASWQVISGGPYTVAEVGETGWDLTDISCDNPIAGQQPASSDSGSTASFYVDPGETVTCTFTNTKRGKIIVEKVADPQGSSQLFQFDPSWGDVFFLADGSQPYDSGPLPAGDYSIAEVVPAGWAFAEADCVVPRSAATAEQTILVHMPPSDIELRAGETVTCTFHNERLGRIIVNKSVSADAPAAVFGFAASFGNFWLAGGAGHDSGLIPAGAYSVAEMMPLAEGWSLASAFCNDGSDPWAIGVSPGETVTCTFNNRYEAVGGSLTIIKRTTPAGGAGFGFDGTLGAFTLDDGGMKLFEGLDAGEYTVTETPADGWEFEDVTCFGPAGAVVDFEVSGSGVTVNLAENQDVTCKFANREEETVGPEGSLTILKVTSPAGGTGFAFDGGALGAFTLDDGGSQAFTDLAAGAYVVTETPAADWEFASIECDALDYVVDGASVTVNLVEGEAAVCTFTNGQLPFTGLPPITLPLLLTGLFALLMGLAMWVWSQMRQAERA
jgi:hypothetical protein